jgi:hypothetical protein
MERTRAYRYTQHFGDPYNIDNKTLVSHDHTIRTKCREKGIEIFVKKSSVPERIGKVQLMLSRISIDKDQTELISSLTQSRYPDDTDKQTTGKVIPVHNEHSHLRTAMEYLVDNLPNQPRGIMYNEGFSPDFSGVL